MTIREMAPTLRSRARLLEASLPEHREGELLVRLQPGASFTPGVLEDLGGQVLHRFDFPEKDAVAAGDMLQIRLPEGVTTAEGLLALQDDPRVVYATPNHVFHLDQAEGVSSELLKASPATQPNDMDPKLWGLQAIHAPEAWSINHGSRQGPIIAIMDSGVDLQHPEIQANLWTGEDGSHGFCPKTGNGDIQDHVKHGTHTFGTIGAVGNNGQGITGINWEARIMPIKVFDDQGQTDAAWIAQGLEFATKHGARITSNSWGGSVFNPAIQDAFAHCPALHIAAAGNSHNNNDVKPNYPSDLNLPNMVSVAASDSYDRRASFSNYGMSSVDLAAPGQDIYSTVPGGYEYMSGTSMACPHVSGVAGLIATAYPEASNEEIKNRLVYGTDKVDTLKGVVFSGGRLNAASALENDTVPPGEIRGLQVKASDSRGLSLQWTAPGDDGQSGTASMYDLRYSERPIVTEEDFLKAQRVPLDAPQAAGKREEVHVNVRPTGVARTLNLALRAYDNVGNASPVARVQAGVPAASAIVPADQEGSWHHDGQWSRVATPEGATVWADRPEGPFQHDSITSLWTGPLSTKGYKTATLVFDAKTELDEGVDKVWLQVSQDGKSWTPLGGLTGSHPWEPHSVDLSSFAGKGSVYVRFSLTASHAGHSEGVQLKNLAILGDRK